MPPSPSSPACPKCASASSATSARSPLSARSSWRGGTIGSVVFPLSRLKFYIDASEEVRASRRRAQGHTDQVAERDRLDSTRQSSPLVIPEGAHYIDNSHLTLEQAVEAVLAVIADSQ